MSLPTQNDHPSPSYRPDIDGLRAIAVLAVVIYHAFPKILKGGFIGVDVFFVISGYLISTILYEDFSKGRFSFANFYSRRIKRIFPSLIIVLFSCFMFGWFVLTAEEYRQLGKHIAAGAGFISNFIFWNEAGYFDNSADTKPLLHLWSLGIEEQFYIIWPLLLWIAWKSKFSLLGLILLVGTASFILSILGVNRDLVATFYSPQTRFWELLSGSLLAWIVHDRSKIDGVFSLYLKKYPAIFLFYIKLQSNKIL
jgi:peptidoglycan/LPS O-acetylase OafA/YrhL